MSSNTTLPGPSADSGPRGRGRGRGGAGGGRPWRSRGASSWRGRGRGRGGYDSGQLGTNEPRVQQQRAPRPTHFLALPLQNHSTLRSKVSTFQSALLEHTPPIAGLDESIIINPRRLHLTLGVMHLQDDDSPVPSSTSSSNRSPQVVRVEQAEQQPPPPRRTITSALTLLTTLQPQLNAILSGRATVKVNLDTVNALKTDRRKDGTGVDAGVLYLAPDEVGKEGERLRAVADLVHQTFKREGYIIENRPLTLHCTIINTSHRRPRNLRLPFSYTDVLNSRACALIKAVEEVAEEAEDSGTRQSEGVRALESTSTTTSTTTTSTTTTTTTITEPTLSNPTPSPPRTFPPPEEAFPSLSDLTTALPIDASTSPPPSKILRMPIPKPLKVTMGTYDVRTVELWRMGSYAPDGGYVCEGVVRLGGV